MITAALRAFALLTLAAAPASATPAPAAAPLDTVVFGGGCFWGVQAVFQHVNGVVTATSGYAGGSTTKPTYDEVSSGTTGHAEVVRVVYDPSKVSLAKLYDVFFLIAHDPTQLNRQGPDHGTQYRSALYFTNEAQKTAAQAYMAQLAKTGVYKDRIVTQVEPLKKFYVAEKYHQDYATLHPDQPYIMYNDAPKIAALKKRMPSLWKDELSGH